MKKTATFIKDLDGFKGEARLYKVSPPVKWGGDYDGGDTGETKYLVVSGVYAMFSGPETYIFPADENGKVVDWGELDGSFQGGIDHVRALENSGYTVRNIK